jgi:hypothetical protein
MDCRTDLSSGWQGKTGFISGRHGQTGIRVHLQNVRFQNDRFQNVRFQNVRNVRFTKRQVFKTFGCKTSCFKTSLLENISKRPYIDLPAGGD